MMLKLQESSCPLCLSKQASLMASVKDYEYNTVSSLFGYYRCTHCGLIYLNPKPAVEDIPLTYPRDYEQYSQKMSGISAKRLIQDLRARLIITPRIKNIIVHSKKKENLKVLDIGCGNGGALLAINKFSRGCQMHGVDLEDSQKELLEQQGITFHQGEFETIQLPPSYFDIIMLIHSIEHFINPVSVIDKVRSLLHPGGLIYLETHRADCLERRIFGPYWIGFDAPRHLTVFNDKTLKNLLSRFDFCDITYDNRILSIGDIIYSFRRYCKDRFKSRILNLLISDRNIFLLLASLIFSLVRVKFVPSSVVRVIARRS